MRGHPPGLLALAACTVKLLPNRRDFTAFGPSRRPSSSQSGGQGGGQGGGRGARCCGAAQEAEAEVAYLNGYLASLQGFEGIITVITACRFFPD